MRTAEQIARDLDESTKKAYASFMARPEIKILISMIPATDGNPELLASIIKCAIDSGVGVGMMAVMQGLMERDK